MGPSDFLMGTNEWRTRDLVQDDFGTKAVVHIQFLSFQQINDRFSHAIVSPRTGKICPVNSYISAQLS
jgi:hypothetical protein